MIEQGEVFTIWVAEAEGGHRIQFDCQPSNAEVYDATFDFPVGVPIRVYEVDLTVKYAGLAWVLPNEEKETQLLLGFNK